MFHFSGSRLELGEEGFEHEGAAWLAFLWMKMWVLGVTIHNPSRTSFLLRLENVTGLIFESVTAISNSGSVAISRHGGQGLFFVSGRTGWPAGCGFELRGSITPRRCYHKGNYYAREN
jgi:hypothetical protein